MQTVDDLAACAEQIRQLVDSSFATRYADVAATLESSSRAVALVEEARGRLPNDLIVAAWTQYGNALRIVRRFEEAEKALERACELPASDPQTRIRLLEVMSSLHRNMNKLDSAAELLAAALEEIRSLGDSDAESRTYNLLGIVHLDRGDLANALRAYQTALDLLGAEAQLEVLAAEGHNLLEAVIADGRLSAAAAILVLLEPYQGHLASPRLAGKTECMRARLYRKLQQPGAARVAYQRAYALMSAEPNAPELAELAAEMAGLAEAPK